jgi:DNA replication and repair protein RecF
LKRNGKSYDKFSDHIGFIPLVIISPDRDLIVGSRKQEEIHG